MAWEEEEGSLKHDYRCLFLFPEKKKKFLPVFLFLRQCCVFCFHVCSQKAMSLHSRESGEIDESQYMNGASSAPKE